MDLEVLKVLQTAGGMVVCLTVLIGLHLYNVKVVIPGMVKENREDRDKQMAIFQAELAKERDQCHQDHAMLHTDIKDVHKSLNELTIAVSKLIERTARH